MTNWRWLYFRKRFHDKIRQRVKTHTLRNERIPPGTLVACPVGLIEILTAKRVTPVWVSKHLWREEGCDSEADFLNEFKSIHPDIATGAGHDWSDPMWLHEFRLIQEAA